jgi:GAF domain-containing protein
MSKSKKIHSRLNKLFDGINSAESSEPGQQAEVQPVAVPEAAKKSAARRPAAKPSPQPAQSAAQEPATQSVAVIEAPEIGPGGEFVLPFKAGDTWNMIQVADETRTEWPEEDQSLIRQVVDQLSLALQNAQLFQKTERQNADLAVLNEMGRELATKLQISEIVDTLYSYTSELMDTANFFIALYNPLTTQITFPLVTTDNTRINVPVRKMGNGLTDHVLRTRSTLLLNGDVSAQMAEMGIDYIPLANSIPAVSWLGVPLTLGERILGAIVAQSITTPDLYTERERDLLNAIASQAAISIENARLFAETQQRAGELAGLNEVIRAVSSEIDLEKVLLAAYEKIRNIIRTDAFIVAIYNEKTRKVRYPLIIDEGKRYEGSEGPINPETYTGRAILEGRPIVDLLSPADMEQEETDGVPHAIGNTNKGSASLLFLPMQQAGKILGMVSVQSYEFNAYSPTDVSLMENIANQLAIGVQNALLFQNTQYRAAIEQIVSEISSSFVNVSADEVDRQIDISLQKIGGFNQVDRAYLFTIDRDRATMSNSNEWVSYGIAPHINDLQDVPVSTFPWLMEKIFKQEPVVVEDVASMPAEAEAEKTEFMREEIKSVLLVPITTQNRVTGFLGFDAVREQQIWGEEIILLLRLVSELFSGALQRKTATQAIQNALSQTERLYSVIRKVSSAKDESEILLAIVEPLVKSGVVTASLAEIVEYFSNGAARTSEIKANWAQGKLDKSQVGQKFLVEEFGLPEMEGTSTGQVYTVSDVMAGNNETLKNSVKDFGLRAVAIIPLMQGGQRVGYISLNWPTVHEFSSDERDFLQAMVGAVSPAFANLLSLRGAQARAVQLQAVSEIATTSASILNLQRLLETFVSLTQKRFNLYHAHIFMLEPDRKTLDVKACGWKEGNQPHGTHAGRHISIDQEISLVARAARTRQAVVVNDVRSDPNWLPNELLPDVRSEMAVPVITGDSLIGILNIHSDRLNAFDDDDVAIINTLASQIGVSIQNVRLLVQAQSRARREQILREITSRVRASNDPDLIIRTAVRELGQALNMPTFIRMGGADQLTQPPQSPKPAQNDPGINGKSPNKSGSAQGGKDE